MAESAPQSEEIRQEQGGRLKYLDFVQVAAIQAVVCVASLYEFAKENAGPLRSGVETVEGVVKTVVGPVYDKLHDVPLELLKFVDRKVDDTVQELERYVPSVLKDASSHAYAAVQQVPEVARSVAGEVQRSGVVGTATEMARTLYVKYEPTAKELYAKYEPEAEKRAVAVWRSLNRMPLFPQVAQIVVPTAAYWTEKYNKLVVFAAGQGYALASYLPTVPIERIAKVFGEEDEGKPAVNGTAVSDGAAATPAVNGTAVSDGAAATPAAAAE